MARPPGGHGSSGDPGASGTPEVPAVPTIPQAGPGAGGGPAPTAWDPGSSRSPYAAAPPPSAPGAAPPSAPGAVPPAGPQQPAWPAPSPYGSGPTGAGAPPSSPGQPAGAFSSPPSEMAGQSAGAGPSFAMPQLTQAPLDAVSVAAVVTGVLATGPVALVLGLVGLRRTTRSWLRSPRIAVTGIVLGAVGSIAWVVVAIVAALGGFGASGGVAEPGDVAEPRVVHPSLTAAGNCVEALPVQQEVGELTLVPCATPHAAQVLTTWEVEDATYPGPEAILADATERCDGELADRGLDDAAHLAWPLVPAPGGWDEGQRTASCLVRSAGAPLTEDLLG
ncbi:DUF4190 domain-containing protein [Litorihabitans aurantiacus]|uniref:Septum formation-related domain-containing protein n=1 Tax=Litorihabitans aurantiacus TaxID=1930061 RepID=A0AA37XDM4_9MICO|nr:septum formation family protein [Litorihabitans aurantiacus]GMA30122.1 hypothetical protein GCM10025875_01140 [Litorihabitans aurantiacus]